MMTYILLLLLVCGIVYAGKLATASIGGVAHGASSWSMNIQCEMVDVTTFLSLGFKENIAGLFSAEVTISGPYDSATAITVGTAVALVIEVVAATGFTVTLARCKSVRLSTDVAGAAQFEAAFDSTGSITLAV